MALNMRLSKVQVPPQPQGCAKEGKRCITPLSQSYYTCWTYWPPLHLPPPAPDPVLLSQFLAKQIQQHDEIRQSGIAVSAAAATNCKIKNCLTA